MSKTAVMEQKAFAFRVKTFDDEQGIVTGYLSTFDNVDEGGDRVRPGAFKRTLANKYQYKKAHGSKYLMPLLWQHDTEQPIGGYTDAKEDSVGLYVELQVDLDVQRGREAYSGLKKGYIFQQSMGYDTIQAEYVKVDGQTVRDLLEVRLWEGSIVTFPMNELAVVTDVKAKSMETKTICGNTSGPIGPRDESWDGSKAEKQIWAAAESDDGSITVATAKKYFMVCDGDGTEKGDYSYPFWYVGDDPHICVGAVITIGKALAGSRGANPPDGLKSKVEALYNRINKKYPDDNQLSLDDGKSMNKPTQRKTLLEHYNEEMAQDLLEDWQDVYVCALTCAVLDAFKIGDQPAADISQALDDFKEVVMSKFVAQAQECGLSEYLAENTYSYSGADYAMQYGSDSQPQYGGYMSNPRARRLARKRGAAISAANSETIQDHADNLHDMADNMSDMMKEHTKALHKAADNIAHMVNGSNATEAPGDTENEDDEGKAASRNARGTHKRSSQQSDTVDENEIRRAFRELQALH